VGEWDINKNPKDVGGGANGNGYGAIGYSTYYQVGVWDVLDSQGNIIKKDAPKFICVRDWYKNEKGEGGKQSYFGVDYGFFYNHNDTCSGVNAQLREKYPGAVFWDQFCYDADNEYARPTGGHKLLGEGPGATKNPDSPWWLKIPGDAMGASYAYTRGFCFGGIISAQKTTTTKDLPVGQGFKKYNAYSLFTSMTSDTDKTLYKEFVRSFFIKELTSIIAVIHKEYAETFYYQLDVNFDSTITKTIEMLLAAVATANGDYAYLSSKNSTSGAGGPDFGDLDLGMITQTILKGFFGAMANTVDPTWRTDWFLPGPFTPFGVVAKLIDEYGDEFFSSAPEATKPRPLQALPPVCDDKIDEQSNYFSSKTTEDNDKDKPEE
jgi:hypothetical protein